MTIRVSGRAKSSGRPGYGAPGTPIQTAGNLLARLLGFDFYLLATTAALTVVGLVMVYSATRNTILTEPSYYIKRQIIYAVIGVIAMCIFMVVDYRALQRWGNLYYGLVLLALLAVRVIGHTSGYGDAAGSRGAVREIAIGPIAIQPSEFAVLAVIISIANYVDGHVGEYTYVDIAKMLLIAIVPMALVLVQPDLGTTMILAVVLFTLLTVAGVRLRWLMLGVGLAVLAFIAATQLHILHGYQLQRITGYLNQNCNLQQNYNLCLSKTAIGAGGLQGAGLLQGAFTNNQYVPVQYADFIFSAIGEQLGFIGSVGVLAIFALMAFRIYRAIGRAADRFGQLICGGVLAFLVFSVFQNVGMTVGLMPITGIPLPFISYGGSALFAFFIAVGIVINVARQRAKSTMTDQESSAPQVYYPLAFIEVLLDLPATYPVVILQEFESPYRKITIPIGMAEGVAIAYAAKEIPTSRPLTHELMADIMGEFDIEVVTLRITEAEGNAFSGELVVSGPGGQHPIPCRVSDGIALCLRQRPPAPITAAPSVINQAGVSN